MKKTQQGSAQKARDMVRLIAEHRIHPTESRIVLQCCPQTRHAFSLQQDVIVHVEDPGLGGMSDGFIALGSRAFRLCGRWPFENLHVKIRDHEMMQ